jgi:hypothetical protein
MHMFFFKATILHSIQRTYKGCHDDVSLIDVDDASLTGMSRSWTAIITRATGRNSGGRSTKMTH